MTTTNYETPPTHIEVGSRQSDIKEVISEDEFYQMMTKDPSWEHGMTFMNDVMVDSSDVPQWKIEEHDITYTKVAHHKTQRVYYVLAWRDATWK